VVDTIIPVSIPIAADDLISQYGAGTAVVQLAYGTASDLTGAATASKTITTGKEYYDFALSSATVDTYYRFRVGGSSSSHDWSPIFQAPVAYATRQELVREMDLPDDGRYDLLDQALVQATQKVTQVCGGRSFFRAPVGSGTKTLQLDIRYDSPRLSLARGRRLDIISLSTVGVAAYTGASYDTVASGSAGYYLAPDDPLTGFPYTDVVLSDLGSLYTSYPQGMRTVQLVGAFGWAAVPELVKRATIDLAREWYRQGPGGGGPVGINQFGTPVFGPGAPPSIRQLYESEYAWRAFVS
jgi:hypothetical protein